MTMFWLPRLEIIGYLLVRSEYVVPDYFVAIKKQHCLLDSWVGDASALNFSVVAVFLVDLIFCCYCFKLPLRFGREICRCLETSFEVRPCHVIKFP